jgi:hypothetical protein
MQNEPQREPTLAEMEKEVLAEGREWMRQRLEPKLQEQADRISLMRTHPAKEWHFAVACYRTPCHKMGTIK